MSTDQISKRYRSQLTEMAQNRESYSETTIPVNWDCPVWKCGNLISTGDVLSIPEPPQLIGHAGRLFRVSRSNQLHFPLAMSRNVVTTLGVSTPASNLLVSLPRTRGVYLPPLYPEPVHADELLTRATTGRNSLRGLSTSKEPLHLCHTVPYLLSQSEPSNSTARYLQFQWNLSTRVEHPSHRGFATWPKFTSLFPPN